MTYSTDKYILGAGIAGLIYGFYKQDFYIVSPEVGGQMKSNFNLGPRYLHDTEISRKFLTDISYPIEKSTIRIAYLNDQGWINQPDLEFRQKYYMKSRATNSLEGFDSSVMNSNKSEFDILLVDFDEIIKKLVTRIGAHRFIKGTVDALDDRNRILTVGMDKGHKYYTYSSIVSTIPINFLNRSMMPPITTKPFESYDMTYVFCDEFQDLEGFDYVYDLRTTTSWHRMTREKYGIVLDFFGRVEKVDKILDPIRPYIRDLKCLKNAQIISRDDIRDSGNVKFIGRYGTWNRTWKTEKVIEEAMK